MRSILAALVAALGLLGGAGAEEVVPMQARSLDLGPHQGIAYYTVERDGYRVVATLANGAEAAPVRFVATLVPGQSVILSVPREAGGAVLEVEIARDGEDLSVTDLSKPMN